MENVEDGVNLRERLDACVHVHLQQTNVEEELNAHSFTASEESALDMCISM